MLRLMSFIGENLVKLSTPKLKFVLILDDSLNVSLNRATVLSTSTTLINYVNASVFLSEASLYFYKVQHTSLSSLLIKIWKGE